MAGSPLGNPYGSTPLPTPYQFLAHVHGLEGLPSTETRVEKNRTHQNAGEQQHYVDYIVRNRCKYEDYTKMN
jgi:hypothetical protein